MDHLKDLSKIAAGQIANLYATTYMEVHIKAGCWGEKHITDLEGIVQGVITTATAALQARVGELLDQWEKRYERVYDKDGLSGPEMLRDCIDDLKGILSSEEKARIQELEKFKQRLLWLHTAGPTDTEGYEWGVFRVKWENGKPVSVMQTLTDMSDLDAAIDEATKGGN